MIHIYGDVHNELGHFTRMVRAHPPEDTVFVVGDFLSHPDQVYLPRDIELVPGNHDPWNLLAPHRHAEAPVAIAPRVWYNSQGLLRHIEGYTIACFGGAESVDVDWRTPGLNWWPDESITTADMRRLEQAVDRVAKVDLLLTHTPPYSTIIKMRGEANIDWHYQQSAMWVELAWEFCGRPPVVCGHMHPDQPFRDRNITVLPMLHSVTIQEVCS